MSTISLMVLEKVTYRRVRPGSVEVIFQCHEVELEIAALFDEPIRVIQPMLNVLISCRVAARHHE